jgi:hypothetical protein
MPSEIFWNSVLITASGIVLACLALCYKSKCKNIKLCGLEIERDIEAEEQIDEIELENKNNQA